MGKSNAKTLISLSILIIFLFFSMFNEFSKNIITNNDFVEFNEKDRVQLKQSGFWDLTGSPIFIDDSDPSKNWSYTASHYDWCSGSGSWADPYVIENITIDGQGSGNCIEIKNSDAYFIVRNCSLFNSGTSLGYGGIYLYYVDNGKIINNNCSDNNHYGIRLWISDNSTFSGNIANNNSYGIVLNGSNNNTLSGNTVNNNYKYGIFLREGNNNNLSGNTVINNDIAGILLLYDHNNTLSRNIVNNSSWGIVIYYSNNNALSENIMNFCGIFIYGSLSEMDSHIIDNTNLVNSKPVYYYVEELGLGYSNFTGAGQIILINCNNSIIAGFNLSDSTTGIFLGYSNNNNLSGNIVNNNSDGIFLERCNNNNISGNSVGNNFEYGIYLGSSNNNSFSENTANNNLHGIHLWYSEGNAFLRNIANNNSYGIYLGSNSNNNKMFLNRFANNEINAEDNGINNTWDDGLIGNYWDDYAGVDANDDGIGDTPYIISGAAGSQDNFPIWAIGDDIAPVITIISPLFDSVSGLDAPNYQITIFELYGLNTTWYTIDGGLTNYTFSEFTGVINQTAWSALPDGFVTITFYANDTAGNIGSASVTVEKDISAPVITIISPLINSVFGLDAPNYNISVNELNLDTIWYTLNGGDNITFMGLTGTINQALWNALPEGNVTIKFYASDTAGNIGFTDVKVIIDISEEIPEDVDDLPIISFGKYYILFTFITITILSFIILEKQRKRRF